MIIILLCFVHCCWGWDKVGGGRGVVKRRHLSVPNFLHLGLVCNILKHHTKYENCQITTH